MGHQLTRQILKVLLLAVVLLTGVRQASAQHRSAADSLIGTWRGFSICTKAPGNEACNDEKVVYHFLPVANHPDSVVLSADKIVGGEVVPMYEIGLMYDATQRRWNSEFRNSRVHILWSFAREGAAITGTCVDVPSRVVRRNVTVRKD